jgi:hypothetical protein
MKTTQLKKEIKNEEMTNINNNIKEYFKILETGEIPTQYRKY